MRPGVAAVCAGEVFHRRDSPTRHEFVYPVSYVWVDPDDPQQLCALHPLWSATRPAPARFRAADYGDGSTRSLASQVRDDVEAAIGSRPQGAVRMLSQVRRWGWLFNPITLFVAWDVEPDVPVAAVIEVTNTPWKERRRYAFGLDAETGANGDRSFVARVAKTLHVSPFLDEDLAYLVRLRGDDHDLRMNVAIDVVAPDAGVAVLRTEMRLTRHQATRQVLTKVLLSRIAPTHRVSAGIHAQAARLWVKRVPFVAHPRKREVVS